MNENRTRISTRINYLPIEHLSPGAKQQLALSGLSKLATYPFQGLIGCFPKMSFPDLPIDEESYNVSIFTLPVPGGETSRFSSYGLKPIVFMFEPNRVGFWNFPNIASERLSKILSQLLRSKNKKDLLKLFNKFPYETHNDNQTDFIIRAMIEALLIRADQENPPTPLSHAFQEILSPSIDTMNDRLSGLDLLLKAIKKAEEYTGRKFLE